MKSRIPSAVLNLAIFALVLVSFLYMLGLGQEGTYSGSGWRILRFYTVLSNLLEGAVAAVLGVWLLAFGKDRPMPVWLRVLNLAAAASVALTFTVVMVWLGPILGYASMFVGANLHFHMTVPLLAVFDCAVLHKEKIRLFPDSLFAVIPTALYGAYYLINILAVGVKAGDWYMLVHGGVPGTLGILALVLTAVWGLGLLVCLPRLRSR